MKPYPLLIGLAALAALAGIIAMKAVTPTASPPPNSSISIQDLHHQVDVKSLPQQESANLY